MGLLGMGGPDIADVIDTSNLTQLALPMISWKLLDFGRIDAQVAQSRGDRDEAAAAYRGAMLTALEDAESALSRFGHGRQVYRTAERAADSSKRASALSAQRYRAGAINGIDNLEVRRRMLIAQQQLSQSRANVSKAFVAVQKSLGLGWMS